MLMFASLGRHRMRSPALCLFRMTCLEHLEHTLLSYRQSFSWTVSFGIAKASLRAGLFHFRNSIMDLHLAGKHFLVTGGTRGIGMMMRRRNMATLAV